MQLADKLYQAVLAEAQVVCVGQPVPVVGDLNADPAVVPCLDMGVSAGRSVDLALAHSLGAGFIGMMVLVHVGDFFIGCPGALVASHAWYATERWFTPHFSVLARFRIGAWTADVACPVACQPF